MFPNITNITCFPIYCPMGKRSESKLRRKGKLLQCLTCKRATHSEKSRVVALYYSAKGFQSQLGSPSKPGWQVVSPSHEMRGFIFFSCSALWWNKDIWHFSFENERETNSRRATWLLGCSFTCCFTYWGCSSSSWSAVHLYWGGERVGGNLAIWLLVVLRCYL